MCKLLAEMDYYHEAKCDFIWFGLKAHEMLTRNALIQQKEMQPEGGMFI